MCGIVGFVNYKRDLQNRKEVLENMLESIGKRGPDEDGMYINSNVAFGHKRLIVIDKERWKAANGGKIFSRGICYNL